ncbi:MAG TPA: heme peroxidase family protein [Pyrinomonadaceae bacterium]|nr:heme peroxidase family protein [Pyrinomonadaceae bacterium]
MARRHERRFFFLADRREVRGEVNRPATRSERERAFRFSEMVGGTTPAPSDELLKALAEAMTATGDTADSDIPAGFTYLGQFIDHDLTRDRTDRAFNTPVTPDQMRQARSPALDLDSVYGFGPDDPNDRIFYSADGARLTLGRTQSSGPPPVAIFELDGFDLPRKGASTAEPLEARMAQIPDPRNDENLVIGQTHLAFMRFHNKVCDRIAQGGTPSSMLFSKAREMVVKHYQWMLRTDFLPRIVDPAIVDDVFTNGRKVFEVGATDFPTMPIEFSVAAYRLGHSMIRDIYDWNAVFSNGGTFGNEGTLENLFRFSGTSGNLSPGTNVDNPLDGDFERLPTNWIADWTRLYDFATEGTPELAPELGQLNLARPIDIRLTDPLKKLPLGSFGSRGKNVAAIERNLAFRNLVRGRMVGLATGQEVAAYIGKRVKGVKELTPKQIVGKELGGLPNQLRKELTKGTPLWFYILREAEVNGGKLGPVGGRIVTETFHRAMEGSDVSILRDLTFSPILGQTPGVFRMTDLLKVAFDASSGELRPLSPDAPRPVASSVAAAPPPAQPSIPPTTPPSPPAM